MKHFCSFLLVLSFYKPCLSQQIKLVVPIGHNSPIEAAVFSHDGKLIASAASNHSIKIWDAVTGSLIHNLVGHTYSMFKLQFSHNDKFLVSIAGDGYAKLWEVETGNLKQNWNQGSKYATAVTFSPDDKKIFVGSNDGNVKIWDAEKGNLIKQLHDHSFWVYALSYSSDGKYFATSGGDNTVNLYSTETFTILKKIESHENYVQGVMFGLNNSRLLTYSKDKSARLFTVPDGKLVHSFGSLKEGITAFFANHDSTIITVCEYDSIRAWNTLTGKLQYSIENKNQINDLAVNGDGSLMALGFDNQTNIVYDVKSGLKKSVLNAKPPFMSSTIAFNPANSNMILSGGGGSLKIWDGSNGSIIKDLDGIGYDIDAITINLQNNTIASLVKNEVHFWDTLARLDKRIILRRDDARSNTFKYSPDGKYLALGFESGNLKVWNSGTRSAVYAVSKHNQGIFDVIYNASGTKLATFSFDKSVKIWEISSGEVLNDLKSIDEYDISGTFLKKDSEFIAGNENGKISFWNLKASNKVKTYDAGIYRRIKKIITNKEEDKFLSIELGKVICWDIKSEKRILEIKSESTESISTATFSPNEKYIITGGTQGSIRRYFTNSGKLELLIFPHTRNVTQIEFINKGKQMVTLSEDNTLVIFDAETFKQQLQIKNATIYSIDTLRHHLVVAGLSEISVYDYLELRLKYKSIPLPNGFITLVPQGFYFGERESAAKLYYTKGLKTITFEQLDIKYNRPDKVLEALGNIDTALIKSYRKAYQKRIKKLGIDTSQFKDSYNVPESDFINRDAIEYEQTKDKLLLKVHGNDSTYKLDRFNIWVNEVPLFGLRGITINKKKRNSFDTTLTITLSQGENRIETSITNVNGTESYRMPLFVKYAPTVLKETRLHFIGIGINQFANPDYNLNWSVKDIRDLSFKLKSKYLNIIIDTLFDANVTKENILALKKKLLLLNEDDKVIVSYSGHGVLGKDFDYYLSTYSINFNNPEDKGLAYDDLESLLDNIKPRQKLMLIDACHSGEVDKEEIARIEASKNELSKNGVATKSTIKVVPKKNLGMVNSFELMQNLFVNVGKGTGATIISAAGGMQYAQERGDLKNGVFTYSIIEAMNSNTTLTVNQLKKIVSERVTQLTNGLQKPTSRNETNNYDWVIW